MPKTCKHFRLKFFRELFYKLVIPVIQIFFFKTSLQNFSRDYSGISYSFFSRCFRNFFLWVFLWWIFRKLLHKFLKSIILQISPRIHPSSPGFFFKKLIFGFIFTSFFRDRFSRDYSKKKNTSNSSTNITQGFKSCKNCIKNSSVIVSKNWTKIPIKNCKYRYFISNFFWKDSYRFFIRFFFVDFHLNKSFRKYV